MSEILPNMENRVFETPANALIWREKGSYRHFFVFQVLWYPISGFYPSDLRVRNRRSGGLAPRPAAGLFQRKSQGVNPLTNPTLRLFFASVQSRLSRS